MKNGLAQTNALLLDAIKELPGPNELSRENAQRENNRKRTRARSSNHQNTECEQREAHYDLKEPLGLMNCLNNHCRSLFPPLFTILDATAERRLQRTTSTPVSIG